MGASFIYWILITAAGAHWNEDIWTLYCSSGGEDETTTQRWVTDKNAPPNDRVKRKRQVENPRVPTTYATIPQEILRVRIDAARDFDRLMAEGRPFVMEDLDIGRCTSSWTADELMKKVDPYRIVRYLSIMQLNFFSDGPRLPYIKLRTTI